MHRLLNRVICSNSECGGIYNLETLPPKVSGICDKCGSELITRKDDTVKSITEERRPFYERNIVPAISFLEKEGIEVYVINNIFELFSKQLGVDLKKQIAAS